uniref:Uncharacterized protein n=1 Tax=Anguilla anguilla TaxID=7936 RepID=A0A0E9V5N5_ANGAN
MAAPAATKVLKRNY